MTHRRSVYVGTHDTVVDERKLVCFRAATWHARLCCDCWAVLKLMWWLWKGKVQCGMGCSPKISEFSPRLVFSGHPHSTNTAFQCMLVYCVTPNFAGLKVRNGPRVVHPHAPLIHLESFMSTIRGLYWYDYTAIIHGEPQWGTWVAEVPIGRYYYGRGLSHH